MNAFDLGRQVEQRGLDALENYLTQASFRGRFVLTHKGPLSRMLQETIGDIVLNHHRTQEMFSVELKCEESERYGNFFLETWSNRNYDPRRVGWIFTILADFIWYYFIDSDRLYVIDNRKLFTWAHELPSKVIEGGSGRMYDFPERTQGKYNQMNKTCGRCVPISTIGDEVGWTLYSPRALGLEVVDRMPKPEAAMRLTGSTAAQRGLFTT